MIEQYIDVINITYKTFSFNIFYDILLLFDILQSCYIYLYHKIYVSYDLSYVYNI